ncbi:hypothetical protein HZ326_19039 [Fusarium oxysporum f. sp. albedinis]|jgi:hypothetical protein|nr:hypothetical protein HZ326_19039 [Fusarium oxysporum f. sp. albedinis]
MPPADFVDLPREVHLLIGRHLQPSEIEGLITASSQIRRSYARAFYHTIAFRVICSLFGTDAKCMLSIIFLLPVQKPL